MQGWNRWTLILMLAVMVLVPPLAEEWLHRRALREYERREALRARYEYLPFQHTYRIDFDGDGTNEYLLVEKLPRTSERWLTVASREGRALVRLPFVDGDIARGTRVAISDVSSTPHLLVYDAVNYSEPLQAVYAFDGRMLSQIPSTPLEQEIIAAMAARDGSEWLSSMSDYSVIKLGCYYFVLCAVICVTLYRKYSGRNSHSGYHFLRGHP
jgi:hypothetical protein